MAVVWAKSNGSWATASIWAFWNENTQQIEDYGRVPQANDVVYCNGYTITAGTLNVPTIALRNDYNGYTQRQGGYVTLTANVAYIFKEIYVDFNYIFDATNGTNIPSIIAADNIYISGQGGLMRHTITNDRAIYITSNIYKTSTQPLITRANVNIHGSWQVVINGNIYAEKMIIGTYGSINQEYSYITINGNVKVVGTRIILQATVSSTINGNINYSGFDIFFGVATTFSSMKLFVNGGIYRDDESGNGIMVTNYQLANTDQYPPEDEVKEGTEYVWGEKVGTYQQPPESVVLKGFVYDNGDKIGSLENQNIVGCVTKEDVREGVELIGLQEVGTLVVPNADDVREGVIFDNGSVGTLIVQGGGDRLRIADFGYYTDAQSDTYIVDLTEQDKPKFAVAEERVLIEMFPDLDFDNIPEKYFDDLFVKYLKYRLIVEYYRTAGINSTFTPSEPTTEIVNYRNVNCEIWMNIANTYLKAWGEKYPNSIKKQRILL